MSYFSNFNYTTFEFNSETSVVKDIFSRSKFISEYKPYTDLYDLYEIQDGETLESMAYKIYGSADLHWVLMIFNDLYDVVEDWPRSSAAINAYCEEKYGVYKDSIKHWVDLSGNVWGETKTFSVPWVAPSNPGVQGNEEYTPVTFTEYEAEINDKKRIIQILKPGLLSEFIKQFKDSLNV